MVAWYWLIVVFLLGNAFATFTYEWFEWDNIWSEIVATLALVVLYIPMAFYKIFLNNTIHPVSRERHEKLKAEWLKDRESKCFDLGKHFIFWIGLTPMVYLTMRNIVMSLIPVLKKFNCVKWREKILSIFFVYFAY